VPVPPVLRVRPVREAPEPTLYRPRPNVDALMRRHWPPHGSAPVGEDGTPEVPPVLITRGVITPPYSLAQLQVLSTLGRHVTCKTAKHKKLLEKSDSVKGWMRGRAAADVRHDEQDAAKRRLVLVPATVTLAARSAGGAALLRAAEGLDGADNLTRAQINEVCPCSVAKQCL